MNQILQRLQKTSNWKEVMRTSCKNNHLKTSLANQLTILKLKSLNQRLNRSYQTLGDKVGCIWIQNELKTFHWVLVAISALHSLRILDFHQEEWATLQSIFLFKKRSFLKFQARRLISSKMKNKHWSNQQSQLLKQVVQENTQQKYQWNDIARAIFQLSGEKVFRTGKHCRERWLNYLDPSKQRGEWTSEEDLKLVTHVYQSGKKWSEYALELSRTEHQVKNRFNSLIARQQKLTPHLRKQDKLICQIKKRILENGDNMPEEQIDSESEGEISLERELSKSNQQIEEVEEKMEKPAEKIQTRVELSDHKQKPKQQAQGLQQNEISDIMKYVKDEQELKNLVSVNQFAPTTIYSPYWSYSSNNGTPSGFMSSPSPLSYYINYNFATCFSRFTNQLHNFGGEAGAE